ncbi:TPA: hypothetical protein ACP32N_005073 [Pseudomonas aeruginosa]
MRWTHLALLLAAATASNAQAEPLVNIPAGSAIECTPFPSIKALNQEAAFKDGKLARGRPVTCTVAKGQAVPMASKFFGQLVDGPVPNSYAFQWEVLQLQDRYSVRWSNAEREQPSSI